MKQKWYPSRIGDQIVWLNNYKTKLPGQSAALGLTQAEVTATMADATATVYALDSYRGAVDAFRASAFETIDLVLEGEGTVPVTFPAFTPPDPMPPAPLPGALDRIFRFVLDKIRTAPGYTQAIGLELGVVPSSSAPPDPTTTAPVLVARITTGGKAELLWTKGEFDGIRIEADRGQGWAHIGVDMRPDFTDNWLPAIGQAVKTRYRAQYIYKGEEFGQWSEPVSVILALPQ